MIVKLRRKNPHYLDLTPHQNYVVIGIEADDLRILNNQGRPHLYPPRLFEVVDAREPDNWITEFGDDGERYAYPRPLNDRGFFEDFFDGKKNAIAAFWQVVNQYLVAAMTPDQSRQKKSLSQMKARISSRPMPQRVI